MINIFCFNWNLELPPQNLIDGTCGHHALRNGDRMLNLLQNNSIDNNNYIDNIKNTKDYKKISSKKYLEKDINYFKKILNKSKLNKNNLNLIKNKAKLNDNIFIIYNKNNIKKNFFKNDKYKICLIIFINHYNIINHWVPIIIDKNYDKVYLHILDSYHLIWWKNNKIKSIIDYIFPNNKIKCKNESFKGKIIFYFSKFVEIIILISCLYFFILGFHLKFKLK